MMQGWEGHVSDFSVFGQSTILDYFSLKHSLLKYLGDKFACFVLRFKGTPNMSLSDQLCNACAAGNLLEIITLLQNGADVNGKNVFNRTAIQVVKLGDSRVIETLLQAGANPNVPDPSCGLTVTHDAAREGFVDSVRALLTYGADVNIADEKGTELNDFIYLCFVFFSHLVFS
uniref:Cyclin-dependent kinase inhibitor 2C (p18, inhibits CDK4) n=1 Tax=Oreochromis niloticus TaxID=8128 RepID=A0A669DV91_ORENI